MDSTAWTIVIIAAVVVVALIVIAALWMNQRNQNERRRLQSTFGSEYDEAYAREALDRYKTLRDLCSDLGEAILPSLPSDPSCFTCTRNNRTATPAA